MTSTSVALLLLAGALPLWSRGRPTAGRLTTLANPAQPSPVLPNSGPANDANPRPTPTTAPRSTATNPTPPQATQFISHRTTLRATLAAASALLPTVTLDWPLGPLVGPVVAAIAWRLTRHLPSRRPPTPDPLAQAATWDLLAACLRAGLPVPTAVATIADDLPQDQSRALRSTADLLAMGADPVDAWLPALACPHTAPLARGARHTARSGTALADVVQTLAATVRASADDTAEARAQRAGVLIAAPLGLCFLPAFVCLGVVPVVAGLATNLSL